MNPYPIDNTWSKGHYVAKVAGPHPRYVVEREFLKGKPVKTRGTVEYLPDDIGTLPAWIIRAPQGPDCDGCGRPTEAPKELIAAYPHGWEVVARGLTSGEILDVYEMGTPGTPTAWTGHQCAGDTCTRPLPDNQTHCNQCETANEGRQMADALAGSKEDPF